MWKRLKELWPYLYEALSWLCLGLATGAFLLALFCYLAVRGGIRKAPGAGRPPGQRGKIEKRSTTRTDLLYHGNMCLTR